MHEPIYTDIQLSNLIREYLTFNFLISILILNIFEFDTRDLIFDILELYSSVVLHFLFLTAYYYAQIST